MASSYEQLVKALRSASTVSTAWEKLMHDAAAAIEALETEIRESMQKCAECGDANMPKRGEWIYHPKDAIEMMFTLPKCSICGHESSDALNYCPNCGAKMEVRE